MIGCLVVWLFCYLVVWLIGTVFQTVPINQIPTTHNQQPTTYHYTFIDILLLIGSILATYEN